MAKDKSDSVEVVDEDAATATEMEPVATPATLDLTALAADIKAQEQAEQEILDKAKAIQAGRAEKVNAMKAAAEPVIAPFRPQITEIQTALGTMQAAHSEEMKALREEHEAQKAYYTDQLEGILIELETLGVPRDLVIPKKGGAATGKRGPGMKASALGPIGSADSPIVVTAPRRRAGDGVGEARSYYCDGEHFYGRKSDGTWMKSERLSEVSTQPGWHDTKDVAGALAFTAGKPYGPLSNPGAVFANGVMVPTGVTTEASESEDA